MNVVLFVAVLLTVVVLPATVVENSIVSVATIPLTVKVIPWLAPSYVYDPLDHETVNAFCVIVHVVCRSSLTVSHS